MTFSTHKQKFPSLKSRYLEAHAVHKICMLQGRIQPVRLGGDFSNIWLSSHYGFTTARGMKYAVFFSEKRMLFSEL